MEQYFWRPCLAPSKIDEEDPFPPFVLFILHIRRGDVRKQVLKVRFMIY
jgi:hypothetical protein